MGGKEKPISESECQLKKYKKLCIYPKKIKDFIEHLESNREMYISN